jgi:outer membrane receptor protein involved in Fe transport
VQVSGAYYRYDLTDLVERYTAGVDLFRLRNRGHGRIDGVELDTRLDAGGGLTVDLVAQVSRGRDAVTGAALDDIAPRSLGLIARHAWRQRVSSYLRLASIAAHSQAGPSEVATPGYFIVDAAAGWRIASRLELRGSIRNALDASYYSSAGPRWVWAPGRQASITLVVASR